MKKKKKKIISFVKKNEKICTYLLAGIIPIVILIIASIFNRMFPFGDVLLFQYDSHTQYPGILLEYKNLLLNGNIFYSFNAGLGFNFLGTLFYYGASPLNLTCLFATPNNYHIYMTIMIYLRFILLSLSMCFYLQKKNYKTITTILFSVCYSLMGFTASYYYNYLWIDSIIMLPIVIYGLDKLLMEKKSATYLITLGITIFINYYIGYMICIFSLLYFIYRIIFEKEKFAKIRKFITSSIIAGLIGGLAIFVSYFALKTGKIYFYNDLSYAGFTDDLKEVLFMLMPGNYVSGDQTYSNGQIYSSVLSIVFVFFFFFNKKITLKEKICTFVFLLILYASLSVVLLNYSWQFFQKPIWWQSRFSFVISFYLIIIAAKSFDNIEHFNIKLIYRILGFIIITGLILFGAYNKIGIEDKEKIYYIFYVVFGIAILAELFFLGDKKYALPLLMLVTFSDLTLNTFNSLKNVSHGYVLSDYDKYTTLTKEIANLNSKNDNMYRMEQIDNFSSNDGLYFSYKGIEYFNSVKNIKVPRLLKKLGMQVTDDTIVKFTNYNPLTMNILGVKYLLGENLSFYEKVDENTYENQYHLGIGYMVNENIKNVKLVDNYLKNTEMIAKSMLNNNEEIYKVISYNDLDYVNASVLYEGEYVTCANTNNETSFATYEFTARENYILVQSTMGPEIYLNGIRPSAGNNIYIHKGDIVKIKYNLSGQTLKEELNTYFLREKTLKNMYDSFENGILKVDLNTNDNLLSASVYASKEYSMLYTTIEYEQGMKIYVDGVLTEPTLLLDDTLIGLQLTEGKHKIVIDYTPKGFLPGIITTSLGILLAGVYLHLEKKRL